MVSFMFEFQTSLEEMKNLRQEEDYFLEEWYVTKVTKNLLSFHHRNLWKIFEKMLVINSLMI
jgi:hypothetical protein